MLGAASTNDHDGLGRLIRATSPHPSPETSAGLLRSERFYYDGIRRIQEVVVDSVASSGYAESSGIPGLIAMAAANAPESAEADRAVATINFERAQGEEPPVPVANPTLAREYIWGPGDGPAGVDELLVQYAGTGTSERGKPWWIVQDGGGDIAAVCDQSGGGGLAGGARVCAQYTYDAYGAVLSAEILQPHPALHCGHKALFTDRLDVGVVSAAGGESPRLVPYAHGICYNRGRSYSPSHGRFLQADPNATAMVLIHESAYHGSSLEPKADLFDMQSRYGNGTSLYQYLGSNAWERSDPLGLFFGFDDLASWGVGGMRGGMEEMLGRYADNMEADIEWALDWSMGDDWHTRGDNKWVNESFAMGFYRGMMGQVRGSFFIDEIEAGYDYLMAGKAGGAGKGVKNGTRLVKMASLPRELGRVVVHESYEAARAARRAESLEAHSHHVVESQMMGKFRTTAKGSGPAVNLEARFHLSEIRKRFNQAYDKHGRTNLTTAQAKKIIRDVYHDAPRVRNEALRWLDGAGGKR